jgi:hypothetical protein
MVDELVKTQSSSLRWLSKNTAQLGVVVVLTSQAYNWCVEKSKRSHDDVERSFYDAIMVELI